MAGLIPWRGFNLLQITSQNSPISLVPNLIKLTTRLKRGLQEEDGDRAGRESTNQRNRLWRGEALGAASEQGVGSGISGMGGECWPRSNLRGGTRDADERFSLRQGMTATHVSFRCSSCVAKWVLVA